MGWKLAGAVAAIALFIVAIVAWSPNASAQADLKAAPVAPVTVHALVTTPAAEPAVKFDPVKATNAYLAACPAWRGSARIPISRAAMC